MRRINGIKSDRLKYYEHYKNSQIYKCICIFLSTNLQHDGHLDAVGSGQGIQLEGGVAAGQRLLDPRAGSGGINSSERVAASGGVELLDVGGRGPGGGVGGRHDLTGERGLNTIINQNTIINYYD